MFNPTKLALSGMAAILKRVQGNTSLQTMLFNAVRLNRPQIADLIVNDDVSFLSYCLARRAWSRAQILQDLWVCFELYEMRGGYFVEFGSTNGLKNSNTWLLETKFGWSGILAEPNPIWHSELALNRIAHIDHRCVSSRSDTTVKFLATDFSDPELSSIVEFSGDDHFSEIRSRGTAIEVDTVSLGDLLNSYDAPDVINYLSVDTEGSELDILSAYGFDRRFDLISVENNPKTEQMIEELLRGKGYRRVYQQFSQWDGWYVSKELRKRQTIEVVAPAS
ncbi:FkbM family methyltransferase [Rhizobium grahamii]|uniref:Methyltransferase n=2 Tax=Rhizobium grahamii TaxID=1120045 RepID=S3H802_9HYPH|nr:FkbM family methyltransferase [Rhizobium grahamii]EPE94739.1 Methyltransferase [Rhizobium grahamii CCGE 502]RDJ05539.1 methyltransferase [Rhizobium grahamii]